MSKKKTQSWIKLNPGMMKALKEKLGLKTEPPKFLPANRAARRAHQAVNKLDYTPAPLIYPRRKIRDTV